MNMLVRFFILISLLRVELAKKGIKQRNKPQQITEEALFKPFTKRHRVLPHDMGFRDHLPNYRYLSFIELNITGWLFELLKLKGKGGFSMGWVISMQEVVYLKQIRFLDKVKVTSALEGWDEKYVYFQSHFYVKGELRAIGFTKFVLVNKRGKLSPQALEMHGENLTDVINTWNANQTAIKSQ